MTLADDIPLPTDADELKIALDSFHCGESTWLTENPVLDLWLRAAHQEPALFLPDGESYFSLNDAESLEDYRTSMESAIMDLAMAMHVR